MENPDIPAVKRKMDDFPSELVEGEPVVFQSPGTAPDTRINVFAQRVSCSCHCVEALLCVFSSIS